MPERDGVDNHNEQPLWEPPQRLSWIVDQRMKIYRNLPCPILSYSFWSRIFPPLFWSSHVGANSAGTSAVFYLPDMECLASFDGVHSRVMSSNCFSWKIIRYSTFSAETKQGTGHPKFSLLLSNKSGCRAIRTADNRYCLFCTVFRLKLQTICVQKEICNHGSTARYKQCFP